MIGHAAAEAAIENLVSALDRLARPLANDCRARIQPLAQHADAADLGLRREREDEARHRRTVAEHVAPVARLGVEPQPVAHDRDVIPQDQAAERGVAGLDAGIEHGDPHAASGAAPQGFDRFRWRLPFSETVHAPPHPTVSHRSR